MAYASVLDFVRQYGIGETCDLLIDEDRSLDAERFGSGVDDLRAYGSTQDETVSRALVRLEKILANVSNLMDGYLRKSVSLPIAAIEMALLGTLQDCCLALARCQLADDSDNATERMDKCCDTWRAWLKDIAAGKVELVTSAGTELSAGGSGKVLVGRVQSSGLADAMRGWGGGYRT